MPTITPATSYPDDAALDIDGHNRNVYSGTGGEGLLSTANGKLTAANLDALFVVQPEHVYPRSIAQPQQDETDRLVQLFGDLFGGELTEHSEVVAAPVNLKAIPGLGAKFHLAYSPSVTMMEWSYFINPQRWSLVYPQQGEGERVEGLALIGTKLDGVLLEETLRPLPFTLLWNETVTSRTVRSRVGHHSIFVDMHYMDTAGLATGWHTLEVCIYLENLQRSEALVEGANDIPIRAQREDAGLTSYNAAVTNAAIFGVRNVRVLPLF